MEILTSLIKRFISLTAVFATLGASVLNSGLAFNVAAYDDSEVSAVQENISEQTDSDEYSDYVSSADVSDSWRYENDVLYREYLDGNNGLMSRTARSFGVTSPTVPSKLSKYKKYNVVDVSEYQAWHTPIDWASLKKEGISGAIIRVGYRGYGSTGVIVKDQYFDQNIKTAIAAGMQVGVYFYTQAINPAEARAEADFVINAIKGYELTLPVYFDIEHVDYDVGRLDEANLSKTEQTALCTAFCDRVQAQNYVAGVYASKYYFYDELNYTTLQSKYETWLAHYSTTTDYAGNIDMWQYSSSGILDGIYDYVDLNLWFGTSPANISSVSAKRIGSDVILSWSRPRGGYAFRIDKYDSAAGKYVTVAYTKSCTYTVTDAGSSESFRVTPYKRMGQDYFLASSYVATSKIDLATDISTPSNYSISTGAFKTTLSWTKVPEKITGYVVVKSSEKGTQRITLSSSTTSYADTNLVPGRKYSYYVRAYSLINGNYYFSDPTDTKTYTPPQVAEPTGITLSQSNGKVTVKWNTVSNTSGYAVVRSGSGDTKRVWLDGDISSYTDSTVSPGATYSYYVRAYRTINGEKYYSEVPASKSITLAAPNPPTPTVASYNAVTAALRVEFNKENVTGYRMLLADNSSFNNSKAVTGGSSLRFDNLKPNTTYYLKAYTYITVDGKMYYSSPHVFNIKTKALPTPTVNYASSNSVKDAIRIEFNKESNITGFKMEIADNKNFTNAKSVTGGSSLRFDYLKSNTKYYLRAYTYLKVGSATYYSSPVTFNYVTYDASWLPKPSVDYASSNAVTSAIRIELNKESGVSRYRLCMSETSDFKSQQMTEGGSSLRFDYLKPDTTYYFKAYTCNVINGKTYLSSPMTFVYKTKAMPTPTVNYSSSNGACAAIRIELSKESNISGYKLTMADNSAFKNAKSVTGGSSLRFDSLVPGTTYYFKAQTYLKVGTKTYWSGEDTFTFKTANVPTPEINYSASNSAAYAIRIEFKKPSAGIGCRLCIADNASMSGEKITQGGSSLRFDGLKSNTTYHFKAYHYVTVNGKTYLSDPVTFTYKTK